MLRQQDCMGKDFGIVFIISFENTGLLASVFLFSLKRRLVLEHNVALQQCSTRTPEATEERWISKDLPSQGERVSIRLRTKWAKPNIQHIPPNDPPKDSSKINQLNTLYIMHRPIVQGLFDPTNARY